MHRCHGQDSSCWPGCRPPPERIHVIEQEWHTAEQPTEQQPSSIIMQAATSVSIYPFDTNAGSLAEKRALCHSESGFSAPREAAAATPKQSICQNSTCGGGSDLSPRLWMSSAIRSESAIIERDSRNRLHLPTLVSLWLYAEEVGHEPDCDACHEQATQISATILVVLVVSVLLSPLVSTTVAIALAVGGESA